jgi:hypothetical protein
MLQNFQEHLGFLKIAISSNVDTNYNSSLSLRGLNIDAN